MSRDSRATVGDNDATVVAMSRDNLPSSPSPSAPPMRYKTLPPHQTPISPTNHHAREKNFAQFWEVWPHKVGKPAAEKAFAKHSAEVDAIIDGVQRYIADKPGDRPWLNPATFLNQERWKDRPALQPQAAAFQPRAGPNGHPARPYRTNGMMDAFIESQRDADLEKQRDFRTIDHDAHR